MTKKLRVIDIAKRLNLSPATVSQVFHNPSKVSRETRYSVMQLCDELGYMRKRRKRHGSKNIGIIGESYYVIFGGFYNHVTTGIFKYAKKLGINVIAEEFMDDEDILPEMIRKGLVDAVLIVGRISREHVLLLKQEDVTMLLCGNPVPGIELHTVLPDGRSGIYEATKHLIGLGHRKIATITGGPAFDPVASERLDGYRFALFEAKIKAPENYISEADFYDLNSVKIAADRLLSMKDKPSAIVCGCDAFAYTVYRYLKEKGIKVPKEISLTGFDDLPLPDYLDRIKPSLTTVHVDIEKLGETAMEVLLEVMDNPAKTACRHTLPTHLIIGETTARIKP